MSTGRWVGVVSDEVTAAVLAYRHDEEVLRRFFEKVDYGFEAGDCWVWTGALSDEGYGSFALPRNGSTKRVVRAHRVAWLWRFGETDPAHPYLDHPTSCVGRFCVSPHHLQAVTKGENDDRATGVGRAAQRFMRQAELALRDERRAAGEWGVF